MLYAGLTPAGIYAHIRDITTSQPDLRDTLLDWPAMGGVLGLILEGLRLHIMWLWGILYDGYKLI